MITNTQSKLDQIHVEQAVVFFIHCFRIPETVEQISANLSHHGYHAIDGLNPKPPQDIYFEPEVYQLFRTGIFTPPKPLRAKAVEHELSVEVTPVIYVLSAHLMLIALRVEFARDIPPRLDHVMRFVEAFRVSKLRQFQGLQEKPRLLTVEITEESKQLEFGDDNQVTWGFGLAARVFKLAAGRLPTENDIVFGNFAKLFTSLFYSVSSELSPNDRFQIINIDRPANPENPKDWKDPLPAADVIAQCLQKNTYPRWEHQKQFFSFMPYAFSMFLEPFAGDRLPAESLARNFERRYHIIYVLLLAEMTFLQNLCNRLARLEARNLSNKELGFEVADLRRELLKFSNSIWSSRISYEVQPSELFQLGREVLGLEKLYDEASKKLSEYDEYLETLQQGRLAKNLGLLQWGLVPVAIGSFLLGLLQFEFIKDWLQCLLPSSPWRELAQIGVVVLFPLPLTLLIYKLIERLSHERP